MDEDRKLEINSRQLGFVVGLRAELVLPAEDTAHSPPMLEIRVEPITFGGKPCDRKSVLRRLRDIERRGRRAVLITIHDPTTQALMLTESKICRGWTIVARNGAYSVQAVIFPKPVISAFVGEADQGEIYEVAASDLQAWDALMPLRAHASA